MPFNESRRDLPPECDEAESSSVRGYRGPHCLLVIGPDMCWRGGRIRCWKLTSPRRPNWWPISPELTGELYDDDEILNFFYNDSTELEQEQRDEITFECSKR
jgi:hypothetical protein